LSSPPGGSSGGDAGRGALKSRPGRSKRGRGSRRGQARGWA
jgi:hypothetical protein